MKKLLIILSMALLVSCSDTDLDSIRQLEVGMTQDEVSTTLGDPGTVWLEDGRERWFYKLGKCDMVCINFNTHGHLKKYYCYNGCSSW